MGVVRELIVDAKGCSADLSDSKRLEKVLTKAVLSVGASIATSVAHSFQPHGLTMCLILKESHLILSTWPEHQLAITNIFLCNDRMKAEDCWKVIQRYLKPTEEKWHWVEHDVNPLAKAA